VSDEAVKPAVAGAPAEIVPAVVESTPVESPEPVRYVDAETAFLGKNWEEATELFCRFTEENPEHLWGQYLHGLSLRRTARLDEAEAAFVAALEISPEHGKSLVNLGRVLLDADRAADALVRLEKACELQPESVDAQRVRGRALHSLDRRAEALEAYAAALAVDENDVWSLNNSGLIHIEEERFEDARGPLGQACAADAGVATFWNNYGVALERSGEIVAARKAYAEAVALDPEHEKAARSLARVEALPDPVEKTEPTLAIAGPATPTIDEEASDDEAR
jgi:Flp pilus assembly protein TadD